MPITWYLSVFSCRAAVGNWRRQAFWSLEDRAKLGCLPGLTSYAGNTACYPCLPSQRAQLLSYLETSNLEMNVI